MTNHLRQHGVRNETRVNYVCRSCAQGCAQSSRWSATLGYALALSGGRVTRTVHRRIGPLTDLKSAGVIPVRVRVPPCPVRHNRDSRKAVTRGIGTFFKARKYCPDRSGYDGRRLTRWGGHPPYDAQGLYKEARRGGPGLGETDPWGDGSVRGLSETVFFPILALPAREILQKLSASAIQPEKGVATVVNTHPLAYNTCLRRLTFKQKGLRHATVH